MTNSDTHTGGGECDFCSVPVVAWAYPCRDFVLEAGIGDLLPAHGSSGAWAACPACHALIERRDRDKLARRAAKRMVRKHSIPLKIAVKVCRHNQDGFWAHREGAPVPAERFTPDPTPPGRVSAEHQLGPDYAAAEAALTEPVKAVLSMRADLDGTHPTTVYFLPVDHPHVRRAKLVERDGQLVQAGPSVSLGGAWDDVRIAVSLGVA